RCLVDAVSPRYSPTHRSITSTAVYTALAPNRLKDSWRDAGTANGFEASENRGDQVGDAVPAKDDRSKAASDHSEKKCGCDGVFHRRLRSTKVAPCIRSIWRPNSAGVYSFPFSSASTDPSPKSGADIPRHRDAGALGINPFSTAVSVRTANRG